MTATTSIRGDALVRNTALNFAASLVPAAVGVLAVPFVVHRLGVERFGILSLAWTILWLASYCDLGLSRATTKFVAEALGRGDTRRIASLVWVSSGMQALLGALAALVIGLATPLLVGRILSIPQNLALETRVTFYLAAACVPFLLLANNFLGVLAAAQRFDLIMFAKTPFNASLFVLPAVGLLLGFHLQGIMFLLFLSRVASALVYGKVCLAAVPMPGAAHWNRETTVELLNFGGWVAVSNFLVPVLVYSDRFIIGALVSAAAVGYYTVSYETVARLLIIPAGLGGVLFPAFSSAQASNADRLEGLYARSLKGILLIMAPLVLILTVFSKDLLRLWLGADFAAKSNAALQILAVGMLLNALSQMPINLLDGVGRPDVRTKAFLVYVLPYLGLLWFLVGKMGIVGAALAWSLRAALELVLFFGLAARLMRFSSATFTENGLARACVACAGLAGLVLFLSTAARKEILIEPIATAAALAVFSVLSWLFVLDAMDRKSLLTAIGMHERL